MGSEAYNKNLLLPEVYKGINIYGVP